MHLKNATCIELMGSLYDGYQIFFVNILFSKTLKHTCDIF